MFIILLQYCHATQGIFDLLATINDTLPEDIEYKFTNDFMIKEWPTTYDVFEVKAKSQKTLVVKLHDCNLVLKRMNEKYMKEKYPETKEGDIVVKLDHDNIVTTYMWFVQKTKNVVYRWLICEKADYDLDSDKYNANKDKKTVLNMCVDISRAFMHLKQQGVAHADIGGSNIVAVAVGKNKIKSKDRTMLKEWREQLEKKIKEQKDTTEDKILHLHVNEKELNKQQDEESNADDKRIVYKLIDFEFVVKLEETKYEGEDLTKAKKQFERQIQKDVSYFCLRCVMPDIRCLASGTTEIEKNLIKTVKAACNYNDPNAPTIEELHEMFVYMSKKLETSIETDKNILWSKFTRWLMRQ